jgi:peroxiredoxin
MPIFQRFYEAHRLEGFVVIAINDGEPAADVDAFIEDHSLSFPVWLDPTYEATDRAFKAANLPTTYVIDRGGRVRLMWIGAISAANLDRYVTPLIKE